MTILLTPDQEQFIHHQLASGKYRDATAVIAEALRLLAERDEGDRHYQQWVLETRQRVEVARAELKRGEGLDSRVVIEELAQAALAASLGGKTQVMGFDEL